MVAFGDMMEKRKPTYDLEALKLAFANVTGLNATTTALKIAASLGFGRDDIIATVQTKQRTHFYKSMTSYKNHKVWQDVYHVPSEIGILYVKFTVDTVTEFLLLFIQGEGKWINIFILKRARF